MTKYELRQLRQEILNLDALELRRREIRAQMENLKAVTIDGMPRTTGDADDRLAAALDKLAELAERYKREAASVAAKETAVEDAIAKLPITERSVIRLYYLSGLKWEEVAARMNYSFSRITHIHGNAIKKLAAIK